MKKLYRSENDSKIAGICGGIGQEFGVDGNIILPIGKPYEQ